MRRRKAKRQLIETIHAEMPLSGRVMCPGQISMMADGNDSLLNATQR
jgi:hypothetical protein